MSYTTDDFKNKVQEIQAQSWYKKPIGFAIARVDRGQSNPQNILQANIPVLNWKENFGSAAVFLEALKEANLDFDCNNSEVVSDINADFVAKSLELFAPYVDEAKGELHKNIQLVLKLKEILDDGQTLENFKIIFLFSDEPAKSVEAVYLKLYALSCAKAPIRSLCLDGAFGLLHNVAWSGAKPYELQWLKDNEIDLKFKDKYPVIDMVDKFPRFLSHIIPANNTRILETSKVRFGAQLAAGTTVMPGASYINFNAGTTGAVMVEGRISSSAIVGAGSDIGGGASILGVLSGTDGNPISIGQNTLLGANSTTGIPIGDSCIIDGGLAIFAGTKICIDDENIKKIQEANKDAKLSNVMKAADLQGLNGIHFRQDSLTGKYVAQRSTREIKLNADLH